MAGGHGPLILPSGVSMATIPGVMPVGGAPVTNVRPVGMVTATNITRTGTTGIPIEPKTSGSPSPTGLVAVNTSGPHFFEKSGFWVCIYCNKTSQSKGAAEMHQRVHTGEKPFACSVCDKRFNTKGNMKAHMIVHAKEQLQEIQQMNKNKQ